jgi:hypothetical protein
MKTAFGMAKINRRNSKTAYLITGITFVFAGLAQYILDYFLSAADNESIACGGYLYLLPIYMGIFIPARNFSKLMSLGGKRMDFFKSAVITYASAAVFAGAASLITHFTIDKLFLSTVGAKGLLNLFDVFGFMQRGAVVAFIQMTVFLTLVACAAHTLTLIQGRWYGWLTDALIIAIISVFTPIAPLRASLVWFFNMIIFHDYAIVQILSAIVVGAIIYAASLIPIRSKTL